LILKEIKVFILCSSHTNGKSSCEFVFLLLKSHAS